MQKSNIYERLSVNRRTKFKKVMVNIASIFLSKAPNKIDGNRDARQETLNKIKAGNNEIRYSYLSTYTRLLIVKFCNRFFI